MTGWSAADDRAAVLRRRRVSYPAPVPTSGRATGRCRAATPGRTRWCRRTGREPRPIVDVDHPRRWGRYGLATTDQAQDGIAADRQGQPPRQPCVGLTTQRHAALGLRPSQPVAATRLAHARPGRRSAKVRSGQWPQRKRRPCFRQVTDRSCRDRSLKVRSYPLCTRAEARPQAQQDAWAGVVRTVISNPASSSVWSSTCRPSGADGIDGPEIGIALPSGHHANRRPNRKCAGTRVQRRSTRISARARPASRSCFHRPSR